MIGHTADHLSEWALERAVAILADRPLPGVNIGGAVGLLLVLVVALLTVAGVWQVGAWL